MKTTIEIPDELFRRAKATAALRGESLKDVVANALEEHLEREDSLSAKLGWRRVFGRASQDIVAEVDAVVDRELETVDVEEWQ